MLVDLKNWGTILFLKFWLDFRIGYSLFYSNIYMYFFVYILKYISNIGIKSGQPILKVLRNFPLQCFGCCTFTHMIYGILLCILDCFHKKFPSLNHHQDNSIGPLILFHISCIYLKYFAWKLNVPVIQAYIKKEYTSLG